MYASCIIKLGTSVVEKTLLPVSPLSLIGAGLASDPDSC